MSDKLWKQVERSVAMVLGGERIPVSGRRRGFSADISHPVFSVEVKHRETLPSWIHEAMNQAEASAKNNQIPLVVLHEKNMKYENCYAIVRISNIKEAI